MADCVFVTDLHGREHRYKQLFKYLRKSPPEIVLIGGDILPPFMPSVENLNPGERSFISHTLADGFRELKEELDEDYPEVLMIPGNDDPRFFESRIAAAGEDLWTMMNQQRCSYGDYRIFGYSFVPPTPFQMKDWERYDVSRYVDVGCTGPDEGRRTYPATDHEINWMTISDDLDKLAGHEDMTNAVFLFHAPPYDTGLDLGDTGGKKVDHVPIDEHMGSIAVKKFIQDRQPLLTLHGHIHESTRRSGSWMEKIGRTVCINGAHDGSELSVVRLNLGNPGAAERSLL